MMFGAMAVMIPLPVLLVFVVGVAIYRAVQHRPAMAHPGGTSEPVGHEMRPTSRLGWAAEWVAVAATVTQLAPGTVLTATAEITSATADLVPANNRAVASYVVPGEVAPGSTVSPVTVEPGGPSLPATGDAPWPLVVVAGGTLAVGLAALRLRRGGRAAA
jgi:LPXTG-motif cell wall-anchored protein